MYQKGGIKKKMRKLLKSKKALSPVVAAIILIAVTVAVSIAVAAWMAALTIGQMGYEALEITKVEWTWGTGTGRYVKITVNNTGTRDVTIKQININNNKATNVSPNLPLQLKAPGPTTTLADTSETFTVTFDYNNGSAYDISIVTMTTEFPKPCKGGINIS